MLQLLETLGARVDRAGETTRVQVERVRDDLAPYELVKTMRASVLVLGPAGGPPRPARVVAARRLRHRRPPHRPAPEGAGEAIGAKMSLEHGYVVARASRLKAARIICDVVDRDGDREPDDGGGAGQGQHRHRERRARARGRGARRGPQQDGRARAGRRHRASSTSRASPSCTGVEHAIVPDRIEAGTLHGGGGDHPRRRRWSAAASPSTSTR